MAEQRCVRRTSAAVVVVVLLLGLVVAGFRSAPAGSALGPVDRVVVVAVPGLRWTDLEAVATPHLDELVASSALLSVQAIGTTTGVLEGYLSFGAGNRLEPSAVTLDAAADTERCVADLVRLADEGDEGSTGAVAGALGQALADAGRRRAVYGSDAALAALMDRSGCVDVRGSVADAQFDADVTLVELGGLQDGGAAAERVSAVAALDRHLGELAIPSSVAVLLVAPSNVDDDPGVTVVAWRGERDPSGSSLQSASTRRAGYLTINDLAPTLLGVIGVAVPTSMNGTDAVMVGDVVSVEAHVAARADLADRVAFRDRTITPVAGMVLFAVLAALVAWARGRRRTSRGAAALAVALVAASFLSGLFAYHHLPLGVYLVVLAAAATLLAAVAASLAAVLAAGAAELLVATLWLMFVADLVWGGALQLTTPLGYTPTVAGRFQGLGNLAFGLFAAAAVGVACSPSIPARTPPVAHRMAPNAGAWRQVGGLGWVLSIAAITTVMVAAPRYGSDLGGTLAVVPTMGVVAAVVSQRRVGWRQVVVMAVTTIGLVSLVAVLDHWRPAAEQTHLGRFVTRLRNGEAGEIVWRKLESNVAVFTASPWPVLFVALVAAAAVLSWRDRDRVMQRLTVDVGLRAALGGFAVLGLLGLLLNDSGIAVPAVMCAVAVPWTVVQVVSADRRERR